MTKTTKFTKAGRTSFYNVLLLGIGFFFQFIAYNATQNFATSRDDKGIGGTSIGILFTCSAFGTLFASFFVSEVGPRVSLVISSATYTIFIFANIFFEEISLYLASALVGFGGAILWTAQGTYLTRCSNLNEFLNSLPPGATMGYFTGTFYLPFKSAQFVGNLVMATLFELHLDDFLIFSVLTGIALCGTICLSFLRFIPAKEELEKYVDESERTPREPHGTDLMKNPVALKPDKRLGIVVDDVPSDGPKDKETEELLPQKKGPYNRDSISIFQRVFATVGLWKHVLLQLLIPVTIYTGLSSGFMYGEFPPLIKENNLKFYTLAVMGAMSAITSYIVGPISDRTGRLPVIAFGFILHAIVYVFVIFIYEVDELWLFMIIAAILAIGDGAFQTQVYAIYGVIFNDNPQQGYANYKLWQSLATAAAFLYNPRLEFMTKGIITLSFLFLGTVTLFMSSDMRRAARSRVFPKIKK